MFQLIEQGPLSTSFSFKQLQKVKEVIVDPKTMANVSSYEFRGISHQQFLGMNKIGGGAQSSVNLPSQD